MHFGPVKRAVKRFLIFLAQSPPKWLQPFPFRFHAMDPRAFGYFEFPTSFAQRKKAKGRRNQKIQTAFSNFRQISAPGPSGNKLILTISFPP
jgi:hypothetical protein